MAFSKNRDMADEDLFIKWRQKEMNEPEFSWPPVGYTISSGDLLLPIDLALLYNEFNPTTVSLFGTFNDPDLFGCREKLLRGFNLQNLQDVRAVYVTRACSKLLYQLIKNASPRYYLCSKTCVSPSHLHFYETRAPQRVGSLAIMLPDVFAKDVYSNICKEHRFYTIKKNGLLQADQTGVLVSDIDETGAYHLCRGIYSFSGPTESFSQTDVEIMNSLRRRAHEIFKVQSRFNHARVINMDAYLHNPIDTTDQVVEVSLLFLFNLSLFNLFISHGKKRSKMCA